MEEPRPLLLRKGIGERSIEKTGAEVLVGPAVARVSAYPKTENFVCGACAYFASQNTLGIIKAMRPQHPLSSRGLLCKLRHRWGQGAKENFSRLGTWAKLPKKQLVFCGACA